jgi:uncharacterized protein (TIGR01244 family)
MPLLTPITPEIAVAPALEPDDFAELARLGYRSIVSNRPDGETGSSLTARQEAIHAWRAGLRFAHVPASKLELFTDPVVEGMGEALRRLPGPVVAHCASGIRSAIVWAAASARSRPVDCVLAALEGAGFDLDFIRDDLEAQADRKRWIGNAAALDCGKTGEVEPAAAAPASAPPETLAA